MQMKLLLMISLVFSSVSIHCAQPNGQDNNAVRDARFDRCTQECNRFCNAYGQKFLLLLAAGTIGILLSSYLPSTGSNGNNFNATAIVPPHAKPQTAIKTSAHNLSAQAALFNFKNARFKAKPKNLERGKGNKQRK